MEIRRTSNKCIKLTLPNGKAVDVLSTVLDEIFRWIQNEDTKPESGGYIVGYQHEKTGNISLESVSTPYLLDRKSRVRFDICDPQHNLFLKKAYRRKSYYMGVWHTHPQGVPTPSSIDWDDWNATLKADKTGCQYVFFIIPGTDEWRLWVGDFQTMEITEAKEFMKDADGIYKKEGLEEDEKNN